MKHDLRDILIKQADWQRSRAGRSWIEKLRDSARMRDMFRMLRKQSNTGDDEKQRRNS